MSNSALPWCLMGAALIACRPAADATGPDEPLSLVIGIPADVGSLDQHFARSALDVVVSEPLSTYLLTSRFEHGRLAFEPGLAERWTFSDGQILTMALRPDATWADGEPLGAEDVAFTFELMADPAVGSRFSDVAGLLAPEDGLRLTSDGGLIFHFARAMRYEDALGQLAGVVILPRHLLADIPREELRAHPFQRAPVLSGCWSFSSWNPGEQITFDARPWGQGAGACAPALEQIVFRVVRDPTVRLLELGTGQLDLIADVPVADLPRLHAEHPRLSLMRRGPRSLVYIGWNQHAPGSDAPHPLFADLRVRRALAQAVDIELFVQDLYADPEGGAPFAQRAVGSITPALSGLIPPELTPLPHDPAAARVALAEAGWIDTDGDGVLDRDGIPFRFQLLDKPASGPRAQVGVAVQADLAAIGVQVDLLNLERTAYFERLSQHDFDAEIGGWSASLYVAPRATWHSSPEASFNFVSYANPEVDALIERGEAALDAEEAEAAWRAMQAAIYADQPYLFLYWAEDIVAVDSRFRDVRVDLLAPWRELEEWKIGVE